MRQLNAGDIQALPAPSSTRLFESMRLHADGVMQ